MAPHTTAITRRVQGLTQGRDDAGRRLVRSLARSDLVPRQIAGARIALDLGLGPEALDLSKEVASALDGRARETFLNDVARRARAKDLVQTVSWALSEFGGDASTPAQHRRSGVERAYLLFDAGEVEEGRRALLLALPGLEPADATEVIQLLGLMGRLSPEGAELLARAGVRTYRGQSSEAARALTEGVESLGQDERPPVLAEAARIADRGELASQAALIRERIVTEFPDSPEVGEAALALARYQAASSDGVATAIALLEELITSRPNAAVVPDARLELERLRGAGPLKFTAALVVMGLFAARPASGQWLLVPMDRDQSNHLRAYGLTYWTLEQEEKAEWLLNYRGGSFLLPDRADVRREAAIRGVTIVTVDAPGEARIRATIDGSNMEAVPLERAPKVAIYTPPNSTPWDDAVTMVLDYAGIEYETIWDYQVLEQDLNEYEWDPPSPRGLHRAVLEVLPHLRRCALVAGGGRAQPGGCEGGWLRERAGAQEEHRDEDSGLRRQRRLPVRDVLGHRDA